MPHVTGHFCRRYASPQTCPSAQSMYVTSTHGGVVVRTKNNVQ